MADEMDPAEAGQDAPEDRADAGQEQEQPSLEELMERVAFLEGESKKAFKSRDEEKRTRKQLAQELEERNAKLQAYEQEKLERDASLQEKVEYWKQKAEAEATEKSTLMQRIEQEQKSQQKAAFVSKLADASGLGTGHTEVLDALLDKATAKYEGVDAAIEEGDSETVLKALRTMAPSLFEKPKSDPEPTPGRNNKIKLPNERPTRDQSEFYRSLGAQFSKK